MQNLQNWALLAICILFAACQQTTAPTGTATTYQGIPVAECQWQSAKATGEKVKILRTYVRPGHPTTKQVVNVDVKFMYIDSLKAFYGRPMDTTFSVSGHQLLRNHFSGSSPLVQTATYDIIEGVWVLWPPKLASVREHGLERAYIGTIPYPQDESGQIHLWLDKDGNLSAWGWGSYRWMRPDEKIVELSLHHEGLRPMLKTTSGKVLKPL